MITRLATVHLMDFRVKIYRDTLSMIRESPWTGTGLGCFEAVFPLYRKASIVQERVRHPESDWLWIAAETGLPGLAAMAGLGGWLLARAWRGAVLGKDRTLRLAVCMACMGVLAHSLVDVPGHRLGTVMPALLLLGLVAGVDDGEKRWTGWSGPRAGLGVLLLGAGSLAILALRIPAPLVNGKEVLEDRAAGEEEAGRHEQAENALGRALEWAPLDWWLYVEKAQIEGRRGEFTGALRDYRRGGFLEPNYAELPLEEGIYWMGVAAFRTRCLERGAASQPGGGTFSDVPEDAVACVRGRRRSSGGAMGDGIRGPGDGTGISGVGKARGIQGENRRNSRRGPRPKPV